MTATRTQQHRARRALPEPDFTDSEALRTYCNQVRSALHQLAMHLHMSASELEAALKTIPAPRGKVYTARSIQRRRARRVARHMRHSAECLVDASASMVRTWGAFRAEYAPELAPIRGRRQAFRVVVN